MNVYIVSFSKTTSSTTALIKEIVHMMDCVCTTYPLPIRTFGFR